MVLLTRNSLFHVSGLSKVGKLFDPCLLCLGTILILFGSILAPCWHHFGQSWFILEAICPIAPPLFGHLWVTKSSRTDSNKQMMPQNANMFAILAPSKMVLPLKRNTHFRCFTISVSGNCWDSFLLNIGLNLDPLCANLDPCRRRF